MNKFLASAKKKAAQPSTWAGLGILGMLFGVKELEAFAVPEVGAAIAGVLSILLNEKPK